MILSGCGTSRPVPLPPIEPLERNKPVEAMQECEAVLSELPADFPSKTVEQALEILLANRIIDSTFYFECSRRQAELARWIKDE